jgi:hypothetical protein
MALRALATSKNLLWLIPIGIVVALNVLQAVNRRRCRIETMHVSAVTLKYRRHGIRVELLYGDGMTKWWFRAVSPADISIPLAQVKDSWRISMRRMEDARAEILINQDFVETSAFTGGNVQDVERVMAWVHHQTQSPQID